MLAGSLCKQREMQWIEKNYRLERRRNSYC